MDFQKYLGNSGSLVKNHPFVFIGGGLIAEVLSGLSLGILTGPLLGAYLLMMIEALRDNRPPVFKDLFAGLRRFGRLFPFFFLSLLIMAGFFVFVIPGFIFATWWLYTLPLMADRDLRLAEAMRQSKAKVREKGFFMHLVFVLMITVLPILILAFLAAILPPLRFMEFLLLPFQCGCLAGLYLEEFAAPPAPAPGQPDQPGQVRQMPAAEVFP